MNATRDRAGAHPIPGRAWAALAAVLAGLSVIAWWLPAVSLDWQPARAAAEPWRFWTAAFVHWSPAHLLGNVAGAAVVGALGVAAALPARATLAWFAAWPLTHAGLLATPELARYGGLSGVLHAGVAVAALWLLLHARGRTRWLAAAVGAGLAAKIVIEAPWSGPALRHGAGIDIAVAPLAHAAGALAGALAIGVVTSATGLARARPLRSPR